MSNSNSLVVSRLGRHMHRSASARNFLVREYSSPANKHPKQTKVFPSTSFSIPKFSLLQIASSLTRFLQPRIAQISHSASISYGIRSCVSIHTYTLVARTLLALPYLSSTKRMHFLDIFAERTTALPQKHPGYRSTDPKQRPPSNRNRSKQRLLPLPQQHTPRCLRTSLSGKTLGR